MASCRCLPDGQPRVCEPKQCQLLANGLISAHTQALGDHAEGSIWAAGVGALSGEGGGVVDYWHVAAGRGESTGVYNNNPVGFAAYVADRTPSAPMRKCCVGTPRESSSGMEMAWRT